MVRPGVMLYGNYPMARALSAAPLEPVMEFTSALVQIRTVAAGRSVSYGGTWSAARDSVVGVIPAGYADGIPRLLSNRGDVIVAGRRVPIVGRVCMDMILADLTDIVAPQVGQRVTLIGREGDAEITAEDWAEWSQTISYEITCGVSGRVPRLYTGGVLGGLRQ
jgi:alanine racemase